MLYIYIVRNFPWNIRISGYLIFLQIQTFCTNNVHNFPLNFHNSWCWIFCANPDIPYIYNIHNFSYYLRSSRYSIFLQIQTFNTYIMYTISRQFKIFKFFANPDIPYILCIQFHTNNVHNFPLYFRCSDYPIFLQILTFHTLYVHNFPFNLRSSWHSISMHIQTFRTYIMYIIFRWMCAFLDIQFFC